MKTVHKAKVLLSTLVFNDEDKFSKTLMLFEGEDIEVVIRKARKDRSYKQNAYYWGVVIKLSNELLGGDAHEYLKLKC